MQQGLTDELYQQVGQYHDHLAFTVRERLAIEFAERFAIDHTAIDDELWDRMREHFSDTEMLELTVTAGFCVGLGRAFQVLDIARDFDVLWSREPARSSPESSPESSPPSSG
jgi:alkylhydroperoxidase family enzyme